MSFGSPCVAQRVCAMPVTAEGLCFCSRSSSFLILPAAFSTSSPLPLSTAMPAES
jgi:hypothetical protein